MESFYKKIYPFPDDPKTFLFYSTRTTSLILIPKEIYEDLKKGRLSPEDESLLRELGFIVDDQEEERRYMIDLFRLRKVDSVYATFVLNTDCNFSCRYCFEEGVKEGRYMKEDVIDKAIDFIEREIEREPAKELLIGLYGGEPFLSPDIARRVIYKAREIAERHNLKFRIGAITNGSLLTRKMAEEFSGLGLEKVRITIDGPPEIHNYFRPFKNGKGSFDAIIRNIKEILDIIRIEIGGNYSLETYKRFPELLDILIDEGITPDRVDSVRFEPIIKQRRGSSIYGIGCTSINEDWVSETGLFLREEILKKGFRTRKIEHKFCLINNPRGFVINVDGSIYKCPGFIGIERYRIGDVFNGIKEVSPYRPEIWKNERCESCVYLPLCYGGCRYMSYIREGDADQLDCHKPFFEKNLYKFLLQDLRFKNIG